MKTMIAITNAHLVAANPFVPSDVEGRVSTSLDTNGVLLLEGDRIAAIGGDVPAVRSRQLFAAGGRHGVYGLRIGVLCGYGGRHRLCAVPAE